MSVSSVAMGGRSGTQSLRFIIGASSVGTLIEWYDFYLYGVLAVFFGTHFFSPSISPTVRALTKISVDLCSSMRLSILLSLAARSGAA